MQIAALPNPVIARSASVAAKPPAPANGAFGATLAAAITNSAPVRTPLLSANRTTPTADPGLDRRASSKSDAQPEMQAGVQAGANSGAKSTSTRGPNASVSL